MYLRVKELLPNMGDTSKAVHLFYSSVFFLICWFIIAANCVFGKLVDSSPKKESEQRRRMKMEIMRKYELSRGGCQREGTFAEREESSRM